MSVRASIDAESLISLFECLTVAQNALRTVDRYQTAKDASAVRHALCMIKSVLEKIKEDDILCEN